MSHYSCFQNCTSSRIQDFRRWSLVPLGASPGASDGLVTGWAIALWYASASPQSVSPDEDVSQKTPEPHARYISHKNCLPDILRWNSNAYVDVMRAGVALRRNRRLRPEMVAGCVRKLRPLHRTKTWARL